MNIKSLFGRSERVGMRPIPFLGSFLIVGLLFALQQWLGMRICVKSPRYSLLPAIAGWELQYLLWGIFCWFLWLWLGDSLQKAGWRYILFRIVPLSVVDERCCRNGAGGLRVPHQSRSDDFLAEIGLQSCRGISREYGSLLGSFHRHPRHRATTGNRDRGKETCRSLPSN